MGGSRRRPAATGWEDSRTGTARLHVPQRGWEAGEERMRDFDFDPAHRRRVMGQRRGEGRRTRPGRGVGLLALSFTAAVLLQLALGAGGESAPIGDGDTAASNELAGDPPSMVLPGNLDDAAAGKAGGSDEDGERRQGGTGIAPEATRGIVIGETFFPGTTGQEWPVPLPQDLSRLNKYGGRDAITNWEATSWSQINCCHYVNNVLMWEDADSGVPDCFCRDVLTQSWYKTVAFCALEQACENALRDFNRVFGEGKMVRGQGKELHTESPLRHCLTTDAARGAKSIRCGTPNADPTKSWRDPENPSRAMEDGLPVRFADILAPPEYGTVKIGRDLGNQARWHWTPGDVAEEKVKYHGFTANDGSIQEGLMSTTPVYPGVNHSKCCLDNATQECCLNSTMMTWQGPTGPRQADCMFAVKRAICAYHFWECDNSWSSKIFNGVCKDTCDDVPKLCGTIPSTGEPLQLKQFTIGGYYNLGCTRKFREQIKDCTNGGARAGHGPGWLAVALCAGLGLVLRGRLA